MQFLAPTFADVVAHHQLPAGGANPPSLYNPSDAVYAAAAYLCDNHVATDLTGALWHYNHSDAYIAQVVTQATQYSETTPSSSVACPTLQSAVQSVLMADGTRKPIRDVKVGDRVLALGFQHLGIPVDRRRGGRLSNPNGTHPRWRRGVGAYRCAAT
ncbi:hypothetical protein FF36_06418 [Frankia torreyi]|uniref:Transglycosylase SLT domain-containing protein n=1 Tax=Frankia torreyi TaxID=1856 RepID=A0A0D8B4V4_9ACTN|nr:MULTISPECIES: hypothetical protein [Frankia]KJE19308.1 hypothetical protein FF36_06418 [Frankia torreyi]KQM01680.1 hypothetical protein FF86_11392 [Frankia sp. CpI1-P]